MAAWKVCIVPISFSLALSRLEWRVTSNAHQAAKIGKEYEARGGDYENEPGSKNKPEKGPPQKKSEATKKAETSKKDKDADEVDGEEKPKANEGKKARGRPKGDGAKAKKAKKEPRQGERSSARQKGRRPRRTGWRREGIRGRVLVGRRALPRRRSEVCAFRSLTRDDGDEGVSRNAQMVLYQYFVSTIRLWSFGFWGCVCGGWGRDLDIR